jgi:curved DNA-binding protein CbpA
MKKIVDYRKLLGTTEVSTLNELRSVYKSLMKTWHPDRFHDNHEQKLEAEEKSKTIIEAYHFLVSIAPETREQTLAEYTATTANSNIADFDYQKQILTIKFFDGAEYEYFNVPRNTYIKLVNADSPGRFARRHIFNEFIYRSTSKLVAAS